MLNIKIFIFVLLVVIQKSLIKYDCADNTGVILLWIHHAISLYIFLGSVLFNNHKIHLLFIICSFIIHYIYKRCPISIAHNKLCTKPAKQPLYTFINLADDIFNVKMKYYYVLIFIVLYDVYFIAKN